MAKKFFAIPAFLLTGLAFVTDAHAALGDELCGTGDNLSIDTAIGCIPVGSSSGFINFILNWAIGVAAGVAFLLIILAGFQILTSTGNPERLKAGQELLTSALMGLVLLIFSVFILNFIGVDVLGIPGFGS
jgi:hypothetical protein